MSLYHVILILSVGVVAGFLNTVAGGGSLLTMPAMIFLGLPSAVANGTNRVAIMVQNLIAVTNFRRKGFFDWQLSLMLGIPAMLGAVIGSRIAVSLSDSIFNKILAVVMIVVLAIIIFEPQKRFIVYEEMLNKNRKIAAMTVFFFVGIYGGLIQAGIGFIIIASLTLITGMSLVRINSLKVFIIALYTISSLTVFIINGKVDWVLGFALAAGNGLGGFLGSNFAVKKGDKWIKAILVVAVLAMALKLLGVFG